MNVFRVETESIKIKPGDFVVISAGPMPDSAFSRIAISMKGKTSFRVFRRGHARRKTTASPAETGSGG